jgi:hypothetical protein
MRRTLSGRSSLSTEALAPRGESPARHHCAIIAEMEALARRRITQLMVLAPPGSAKTT